MVVIIHKKVVIKYVKGSYYPSSSFLNKLSFFFCVGFRSSYELNSLLVFSQKKKKNSPSNCNHILKTQ